MTECLGKEVKQGVFVREVNDSDHIPKIAAKMANVTHVTTYKSERGTFERLTAIADFHKKGKPRVYHWISGEWFGTGADLNWYQ